VPIAFRFRFLAALAACLGLLAAPALADDPITHAQPQLRLEPLTIVTKRGAYRFQAEIADTPRSQEVGLMYRPVLAPDRAMLFEMGEPNVLAFWMEHCAHPLDMLFILPDGRILTIARMTKPFSRDPISSGGPVSAVLEIRGGRAAEIGAEPGDEVRHDYFRNG
jgi:uncharacterized membrane protein (UPF0127 family)